MINCICGFHDFALFMVSVIRLRKYCGILRLTFSFCILQHFAQCKVLPGETENEVEEPQKVQI